FVQDNWLNRTDAYAAALFYMVIYAIMTVGAFGMLIYLSHAGFECENLDDMKGLNRRHPWYAFLMLLIMFALAGIPPTAGFYAKLRSEEHTSELQSLAYLVCRLLLE